MSNDHAMTDINELVKRLESRFHIWLSTSGGASVKTMRPLLAEAATALRELQNRVGVLEYKLDQAVNFAQPALIQRAEAAEKRVRELEAERDANIQARNDFAKDWDAAHKRAEAAEAMVEQLEEERDMNKKLSLYRLGEWSAAVTQRDELVAALKHIANHSSMLDDLENCMEMRRMAKTTLAKVGAL